MTTLPAMGHAARRWFTGWWQIIHLGAVLLVLAMSPSSYGPQVNRQALARQLLLVTGPVLLWFTVVSSLISLIVIRLVVVTALSYGLSSYALEMVVRVLVLELIPLSAALAAALRLTLPNGAAVARQRSAGGFKTPLPPGADPWRQEVLPRVLAGMFAVAMLAAVSCLATLVLAYWSVHGFTLGGFDRYTRTVGRVFSPAVSVIFALKVALMSLAVSVIPMASALYDNPPPGTTADTLSLLPPATPFVAAARIPSSADLQGLVRMFLVLLLIESASLVGNYY